MASMERVRQQSLWLLLLHDFEDIYCKNILHNCHIPLLKSEMNMVNPVIMFLICQKVIDRIVLRSIQNGY
jgi:hypothetical protein